MNTSKYLLYTICLVLFIVFSCKNENASVDLRQLNGQWNIVNASRNGKVTNTLDNAFIRIESDKLFHNLNGDTISAKYNLDENIMMVEDETIQELNIEMLTTDSLKLNTKISNFKFKFTLTKNEN